MSRIHPHTTPAAGQSPESRGPSGSRSARGERSPTEIHTAPYLRKAPPIALPHPECRAERGVSKGGRQAPLMCHSREGGNPECGWHWIPAFAGKTAEKQRHRNKPQQKATYRNVSKKPDRTGLLTGLRAGWGHRVGTRRWPPQRSERGPKEHRKSGQRAGSRIEILDSGPRPVQRLGCLRPSLQQPGCGRRVCARGQGTARCQYPGRHIVMYVPAPEVAKQPVPAVAVIGKAAAAPR